MTDEYPDALAAVRALLNGLDGDTYFTLTVDFAKNLPAYLIYRTGGSESFPFREDRITVETYAAGSTAARRAAEAVRQALSPGPHDGPDGTVIDAVAVDTIPVEVPQYAEQPALVTATYRVQTRAI